MTEPELARWRSTLQNTSPRSPLWPWAPTVAPEISLAPHTCWPRANPASERLL